MIVEDIALLLLGVLLVLVVYNRIRNRIRNKGIHNGHQWVDLGLPSGTLWATCNVGANFPEEYGDCFAWGETTPKSNYNWSTYKYGKAYNKLTKYCNDSDYGKNGFTDTKTTLDAGDDAATANWGREWRMPTLAEIEELYNNCSSTWTTQNGVKGCKFTASNGNSIFLPAAGNYDASDLGDAGSSGVWSASLLTGGPVGAYLLYFNSGYVRWSNNDRYCGLSVRPVVKRYEMKASAKIEKSTVEEQEGVLDEEETTNENPQEEVETSAESADEIQTAELPDQWTFEVNGVSFTMVKVEGGTFMMGATPEQGEDALDGERPVHQVSLDDYYIGQTQVTQALWQAVMGMNPSKFKGKNNPVEYVYWYDCQEFVKKLSKKTGRRFRLPTEAQWEYAARGGNKSKGYKYAGGNDLDAVAWYNDNSSDQTHPVAQKAPNELGLYDMSGNVWEWCADWFGRYSEQRQHNPTGPASGSYWVRRGGSWDFYARFCRVSSRGGFGPVKRASNLGLRLVLVP